MYIDSYSIIPTINNYAIILCLVKIKVIETASSPYIEFIVKGK